VCRTSLFISKQTNSLSKKKERQAKKENLKSFTIAEGFVVGVTTESPANSSNTTIANSSPHDRLFRSLFLDEEGGEVRSDDNAKAKKKKRKSLKGSYPEKQS
jgi:hypothetical protein